MHELSIAQALLDQVNKVLAGEGRLGADLRCLHLELGAWSGVDREAFEFVWPFVVENTALAMTKLDICETPAKVHCKVCGREGMPEFPLRICPYCDSPETEMLCGADFVLKSLDFGSADLDDVAAEENK